MPENKALNTIVLTAIYIHIIYSLRVFWWIYVKFDISAGEFSRVLLEPIIRVNKVRKFCLWFYLLQHQPEGSECPRRGILNFEVGKSSEMTYWVMIFDHVMLVISFLLFLLLKFKKMCNRFSPLFTAISLTCMEKQLIRWSVC